MKNGCKQEQNRRQKKWEVRGGVSANSFRRRIYERGKWGGENS
jgi:hypothetical protein